MCFKYLPNFVGVLKCKMSFIQCILQNIVWAKSQCMILRQKDFLRKERRPKKMLYYVDKTIIWKMLQNNISWRLRFQACAFFACVVPCRWHWTRIFSFQNGCEPYPMKVLRAYHDRSYEFKTPCFIRRKRCWWICSARGVTWDVLECYRCA